MSRPFKVAVFASGGGSNFQALIDKVQAGELDVQLDLLVSDKPQSKAVERAKAAGIDTYTFNHRDYATREEYERLIVAEMDRRGIDLVVLAGFMRLFTNELVAPYYGRMINIHPALLPAFKGAHGIADALAYGAKVTGVTIHYVSLEMDAGPIIAQEAIAIREDDTEETLAPRVQAIEHKLLPQVVGWIRAGRVKLAGTRASVEI